MSCTLFYIFVICAMFCCCIMLLCKECLNYLLSEWREYSRKCEITRNLNFSLAQIFNIRSPEMFNFNCVGGEVSTQASMINIC